MDTMEALLGWYRAQYMPWTQPLRLGHYACLGMSLRHLYATAGAVRHARECLAFLCEPLTRDAEGRPKALVDDLGTRYLLREWPRRDELVRTLTLPAVKTTLAALPRALQRPYDARADWVHMAPVDRALHWTQEALAEVEAELARDPDDTHTRLDEAAWALAHAEQAGTGTEKSMPV